jgi:hypothetical protein
VKRVPTSAEAGIKERVTECPEREEQIKIWSGLEYNLTIIGFLDYFIHTTPN